MKIGVVGCGALGSYYGGKLCRAGENIFFLLRSDYEVVRRNGLRIQSAQGNFHIQPKCVLTPEEIGVCDLVVVGLKTTANHQFEKLIPPLVGRNTAILTLQNGLGNEEKLAQLFGPEKILGGLCFVCLNRVEAGVIQHVAHGRIIMGEFQRGPEPRTHEIASLFRHAGIPCEVTDNLAQAHWDKLVWNIPFNGLGVAGSAGLDAVLNGKVESQATPGVCLTTDILLDGFQWERLVRELMKEVIRSARALGLKVEDEAEERQIARTRDMGPYKASTLVDFERKQPLELEALFLEPLRQAQAKGVSVPRLQALCQVLQQLDGR